VVTRRPGIILDRAVTFYLKGYTIYEARSTWTGKLYANRPMRLWMRAYEILKFQHFGDNYIEEDAHTSFVYIFPLIILFAVLGVFRFWKNTPGEAMTAAFMLYCILWVLLMTLLVNGFEGNRYRFPTEPYTLILAGWVLSIYRRSRTKTLIICAIVLLCIAQGVLNWALWA